MANNYSLGRNLHMCFSKVKRPSTAQLPLPEDHSRPFPTSVFIKNFNSLYDFSTTSNNNNPLMTHSPESNNEEDPLSDDTTPDFATVYASQRFFFSSPGRSNSIIDSSSLSSPDSDTITPPECEDKPVVKNSVAVPTYSPDPYADFRRSMQEMVEARKLNNVGDNWEYLHELLFCYLALNPKSTHKFIIGAFSDLVISLVSAEDESGNSDGGRRKDKVSGCCVGGSQKGR